MDDAIVNPVKGRRSPALGPTAVLVSTQMDLADIRKRIGLTSAPPFPLYTGSLFPSDDAAGRPFSVAGPVVGAPYAVMMLETLVAWGARQIVYLGWCGAVSARVAIGDLIVPSGALIDEGTSRHYDGTWSPAGPRRTGSDAHPRAAPSERLAARLSRCLPSHAVPAHSGLIWTTDGIYRETAEKAAYFQKLGALAVDMEISALFTAGAARGVEVAALTTVSDDLSSLRWRPGFKTAAFRAGREAAVAGLLTLCAPDSPSPGAGHDRRH